MQTIRLRINDKIYGNLMWLLGKFKKEEIEVITEDEKFLSIQSYLQRELNEIKEGKALYYTMENLENDLEEIIKKHDNKN